MLTFISNKLFITTFKNKSFRYSNRTFIKNNYANNVMQDKLAKKLCFPNYRQHKSCGFPAKRLFKQERKVNKQF